MAHIEIDGLDTLMSRLADRESGFGERAKRALELAAGELREQLRREEEQSFVDPSGELGKKLVWDAPYMVAGAVIIEVYAKGSYKGRRGKARRAGLVAAMVEYKHGNPWNARAREASRERINSIFAQELGIGD